MTNKITVSRDVSGDLDINCSCGSHETYLHCAQISVGLPGPTTGAHNPQHGKSSTPGSGGVVRGKIVPPVGVRALGLYVKGPVVTTMAKLNFNTKKVGLEPTDTDIEQVVARIHDALNNGTANCVVDWKFNSSVPVSRIADAVKLKFGSAIKFEITDL